MKILDYFKSLVASGSGNSSKSFALLLSALIGALMGLCICFILIFDVAKNGHIETDLDKLGWFLLCSGAYSFGAGAGKIITDSISKKTPPSDYDTKL